MFERSELQVIKESVIEPRKFIQVIMGPRQVGKTTLVNQLLKQIDIPFLFESADSVPVVGKIWLEQQWELARLKQKNQLSRICNPTTHFIPSTFNSSPPKLSFSPFTFHFSQTFH